MPVDYPIVETMLNVKLEDIQQNVYACRDTLEIPILHVLSVSTQAPFPKLILL